MDTAKSEQHVDLLVIGGGAAGMTAALTAKLEGLDVLLCEKAPYVGGITATSGGTTWVPGTHLSVKAGVPDSVDAAREFLSHVCKDKSGGDLREAFLRSGPQMIQELDDKTEVKFVAAQAHPDYIGPLPGEAYGGRALAPVAFDGKLLGADFDRVRPPRREFMGLGGMMVNRSELGALLKPFASLGNLKTTLGVVLPYFKDRLSYKRGTRLVMGNALVGRLYYSLKQAGVPVWFESSLQELLLDNGKVTGAVVRRNGQNVRITASKGVVLATGGAAWNPSLRQRFFPEGTPDSFAPKENSGDGITAAEQIGGALDNTDFPALWFPTSFKTESDGYRAMWPHIILDRAKPGLFAVASDGRRFANESNSYHDFSSAQLARHRDTPALPAYLIADEAFVKQYGLGFIMPGGKGLTGYVQRGYVQRGQTWTELAQKIGVPAENLQATAQRYNELAATGEDTDFGRGTSAMNRFNGDAAVKSNPCLRPLASQGPYYALAVRSADLAGSVGLACNAEGQVLRENGQVIDGLFACGNDLASIFKGTYPGPGTTIGPGMVFGWRIAKFAAGKL
ncbi:FAD-dependent oxidoreductase [Neisseria perflava]|uniref:FAD-dependent oxidoreductase n=1 Tax=Neisseria perflava TaxID=33053 RepID=UPI0020A1B410|nr:FAD-dependent oxidoreductase [Neisseria perflava]MCP1660439.1 succinate dehydrogenase/fumarate reductase flavoprotein subunit [Neisseria perflava]